MSVASLYAMQSSASIVHKCKEANVNHHNLDKSGTVVLMLFFTTPDWKQALQSYIQTNNRGIGAALKHHPASPISEEERNKTTPLHLPRPRPPRWCPLVCRPRG